VVTAPSSTVWQQFAITRDDGGFSDSSAAHPPNLRTHNSYRLDESWGTSFQLKISASQTFKETFAPIEDMSMERVRESCKNIDASRKIIRCSQP
jgi:hypothetical protein